MEIEIILVITLGTYAGAFLLPRGLILLKKAPKFERIRSLLLFAAELSFCAAFLLWETPAFPDLPYYYIWLAGTNLLALLHLIGCILFCTTSHRWVEPALGVLTALWLLLMAVLTYDPYTPSWAGSVYFIPPLIVQILAIAASPIASKLHGKHKANSPAQNPQTDGI